MISSKNYLSVLIPDADSFVFPYILHCMSHIKNCRLYALSNDKKSPYRYSRYVHRFFYYPEKNDPKEWIQIINEISEEHQIDIIMPTFETGIKTLIEYKTMLSKNIEKLVPLPSLHDFQIANSKALLAEHLKKQGLPVPNTVFLSPDIISDEDKLNLRFPLLAKPLESGNGRGIVRFENHKSLAEYFNNLGIKEDYILQEYVSGAEYGFNVLCKDGEILAYTMQKGTLWDPSRPYSAQIGLEFLYNENLYQTVKKLMKSLNWSGVADIDLLYTKENDTFYVVEINPRFWLTVTSALMAGINYPHLLLLLTMKKDIGPQRYKYMPYVNLKGLLLSCKKDISILFKFNFIWNNTPLKYKLFDPLPFILRLFIDTKNFLTKNNNTFFGKEPGFNINNLNQIIYSTASFKKK